MKSAINSQASWLNMQYPLWNLKKTSTWLACQSKSVQHLFHGCLLWGMVKGQLLYICICRAKKFHFIYVCGRVCCSQLIQFHTLTELVTKQVWFVWLPGRSSPQKLFRGVFKHMSDGALFRVKQSNSSSACVTPAEMQSQLQGEVPIRGRYTAERGS